MTLPAWTGEVVGTLHVNRIPQKALAAELGLHEKYLCGVLAGKRKIPADMESRCREALARLIARKEGEAAS